MVPKIQIKADIHLLRDSEPTQSLVEESNRQVGSNAWTSVRAVHDLALIAELQGRGTPQK